MCKTTLLKHKRGGVRLHFHSKGFTLSLFFQVMVYRHWTKTVLIGLFLLQTDLLGSTLTFAFRENIRPLALIHL